MVILSNVSRVHDSGLIEPLVSLMVGLASMSDARIGYLFAAQMSYELRAAGSQLRQHHCQWAPVISVSLLVNSGAHASMRAAPMVGALQQTQIVAAYALSRWLVHVNAPVLEPTLRLEYS